MSWRFECHAFLVRDFIPGQAVDLGEKQGRGRVVGRALSTP